MIQRTLQLSSLRGPSLFQILPFIRLFASDTESRYEKKQSEKQVLIKRLVQVKRVSHTTIRGKQRQVYALVHTK